MHHEVSNHSHTLLWLHVAIRPVRYDPKVAMDPLDSGILVAGSERVYAPISETPDKRSPIHSIGYTCIRINKNPVFIASYNYKIKPRPMHASLRAGSYSRRHQADAVIMQRNATQIQNRAPGG